MSLKLAFSHSAFFTHFYQHLLFCCTKQSGDLPSTRNIRIKKAAYYQLKEVECFKLSFFLFFCFCFCFVFVFFEVVSLLFMAFVFYKKYMYYIKNIFVGLNRDFNLRYPIIVSFITIKHFFLNISHKHDVVHFHVFSDCN